MSCRQITDIGSIDVEFIADPDPKFNKASVKGPGVVSLTGAATAIAHAVYHGTGRCGASGTIRIERLL